MEVDNYLKYDTAKKIKALNIKDEPFYADQTVYFMKQMK